MSVQLSTKVEPSLERREEAKIRVLKMSSIEAKEGARTIQYPKILRGEKELESENLDAGS
jgi:hypothetical protein